MTGGATGAGCPWSPWPPRLCSPAEAAPTGSASPPEEGETPAAEPPAGPPPSTASAYVPGYSQAELTAPDSGYEFDLRAGKVVPVETAAWYLARGSDAFLLSEESDAFAAEEAES